MKQSIRTLLARLIQSASSKPSNHFDAQQSELAFVIADISGYTEYIKANAESSTRNSAKSLRLSCKDYCGTSILVL
ncbi:MAG: hypothetical protein EBZ42_11910 [Betaproteobacteria bacterium]|nr:hypothetical protein [Betaproteobacteria bacterium]